MKEEFPLVAGPKVTKLVTTYDPAHDNVIVVESIDSIPKPPNHITIFDLDEHYTTVSYDFVGNNKLSGLKVIEGDEKHVYKIGDYVVRTIDKYDFEAIISHIKYLETHKLDKFQGKCKSGQIMAVDGDGFVKPQVIESLNAKWGGIEGNINRQEDLMEKFDEKVDIKQGVSARGKVLRVGDFGDVETGHVKFSEIEGSIATNPEIVAELNKKQDKLVSGVNIKKINNEDITGAGNIEIPAGVWGRIGGNIADQTDLVQKLAGKQDNLVSGINIKTINNKDITGAGNITIDSGTWGNISGNINDQTDLKTALATKFNTNQGAENKNRPLIIGLDGNVIPGSEHISPYIEGELCIFPTESEIHVVDTTVVF